MSNPFTTADPWKPSAEDADQILPVGDHVVTIQEADGAGTSSGGHPQIELRLGNERGTIRDWIVVIPSSIGRVVQMTDAAGMPRPEDDQVTQDGTGFRIAPAYLDALVGKQVGLLVRNEPDYKDPTKMRTRVKGYVPAQDIQTDMPTDWRQQVEQGQAAFVHPKAPADDEIPF